MIHPPPEAFVRATELHRAQVKRRETSSAVQILGWMAAALLTLGLHIGLYLALTRQEAPPPAPIELPAAVMIDMSPEPTVAKSTTDNASNEPEAPNSQQAEPEPVEEPPPPDLEPVVEAPPPPPEIKPMAVLPPKQVKKPEPKPPEKKVEKKSIEKKPEKPVQKKDKPSAASRSGGGPKSDQQNANRTAASSAGSAISQASRATWQNEMRARIVRMKRYPSNAFGAVGVAVVNVTFAGNGSVTSAHLARSSGNAALDAEAVAVIYRAAPYPPPPGNQPIVQAIPLNFNRR